MNQDHWRNPITDKEQPPETYPGTLRGYRHFNYNTAINALTPMFAGRMFSYSAEFHNGEWITAECRVPMISTFSTLQNVLGTDPSHRSPDKGCSCGFYINYLPGQTFYKNGYDSMVFRGVVETSGRILLSEKGFRAEKMKLVALAPETDVNMSRYSSQSYTDKVKNTYTSLDVFKTVKDMYDKYPQQDLSSLIGSDRVINMKAELARKPIDVAGKSLHTGPAMGRCSCSVCRNIQSAAAMPQNNTARWDFRPYSTNPADPQASSSPLAWDIDPTVQLFQQPIDLNDIPAYYLNQSRNFPLTKGPLDLGPSVVGWPAYVRCGSPDCKICGPA